MFYRSSKPLLLVLLVHSAMVQANSLDDFQVHGFVSQAAIHTTANRFGGNSDSGITFDYREAGIGGIWQAQPNMYFAGQILARQSGETDPGSIRIDHLIMDYRLTDSDYGRYGVQVGKVKHPFGLFNTTRDVAHTRTGILLPQSIYHDRVRDLALSAPGISLYGARNYDNDALDWRVNIFKPVEESHRLEALILGKEVEGEYSGDTSWVAQALYGRYLQDGKLVTGISLYDFRIDFSSDTMMLGNGKSRLSGAILSMEYSIGRWEITSEILIGNVKSDGYGIQGVDRDNMMDAGYVQINYRPAEDWTLYARLGALYLDTDDRDGSTFHKTLGGKSYSRYAKDITLGVRKDIGRWSVWLEWVGVEGTAWLSDIETPSQDQHKDWSMFMTQVAYRW